MRTTLRKSRPSIPDWLLVEMSHALELDRSTPTVMSDRNRSADGTIQQTPVETVEI